MEKWIVQKIRDKKTEKGKVYYLCKWKGFKVSEATWESKANLIEDGFESEIKDFEQILKSKKKK